MLGKRFWPSMKYEEVSLAYDTESDVRASIDRYSTLTMARVPRPRVLTTALQIKLTSTLCRSARQLWQKLHLWTRSCCSDNRATSL